jgi:thiol-disulfide isomerase/thioredoxin
MSYPELSAIRGGCRRQFPARPFRGSWPRAACLLAIALALGAAPAARAAVNLGAPFPVLASIDLAGGPLPATQGKVMLVDFWASWCPPCKASFPAYAKLYTDYVGRGLVIVAVSVDESPVAYAAFVRRFNPPFAALYDRVQQLVRAVNVPAMPTCYLVGRDGRVRYVHEGFHGEDTERELRREIDTLLAERS